MEVRTPAVKCPKCGFVSYAGLPQCKKCGYEFRRTAPELCSSSTASSFSQETPGPSLAASPGTTPGSIAETKVTDPKGPLLGVPPAYPLATVTDSQDKPLLESPPQRWLDAGRVSVPEADASVKASDWREELSNRIQDYRKRRAKLQREADAPQSLDLDFDSYGLPDQPVFIDEEAGKSGERAPDLDWELDNSGPSRSGPAVTLETLEKSDQESTGPGIVSDSEREFPPAAPETTPMDIVVDLPEVMTPAEEESLETAFLAPVGRRFLAGLTDATVLVLSAGLFGIIFWRSGGHLSPNPLNFAVLGVVGVVLIFAYFALFTALTSTTPGLLWLGCEIRNLHGECPNVRESCWRSFGVLVSLSSLLLGFIWALVDSECLTWHDRMSGTFITLARTEPEAPRQGAEV